MERTLEPVYAIRPDVVIVNRFNYSIAWMEQPQEGLGLYHSGHFEPCEELGFEVYNHVQQQVYALNQETGVILKVDKAGTYLLTLNVVTNTNGPVLQVFADGQPIGEKIVMSNTAGAWRYESLELAVVTPEAGDHVLSFRSVDVASDAFFILDNLYLNEINPAETDEPTTDEPAPDDYFTPGTHRGAIKERWFSSVICAMNGPAAAPIAAKGVTIENHSSCEPPVLLKHFPVYDGMPQ